MLLAWPDAQLRRRCATGTSWQKCSSQQQAAAQDLLITVCEAPTLRDLLMFRSVHVTLMVTGGLGLAMEEVDMHVRLLTGIGQPLALTRPASLLDHGEVQAMIVDDVIIAGQSLSRTASWGDV